MSIYIQCGSEKYSLSEWQKRGYDLGSTVLLPVSTATIIEWGKNLLRQRS